MQRATTKVMNGLRGVRAGLDKLLYEQNAEYARHAERKQMQEEEEEYDARTCVEDRIAAEETQRKVRSTHSKTAPTNTTQQQRTPARTLDGGVFSMSPLGQWEQPQVSPHPRKRKSKRRSSPYTHEQDPLPAAPLLVDAKRTHFPTPLPKRKAPRNRQPVESTPPPPPIQKYRGKKKEEVENDGEVEEEEEEEEEEEVAFVRKRSRAKRARTAVQELQEEPREARAWGRLGELEKLRVRVKDLPPHLVGQACSKEVVFKQLASGLYIDNVSGRMRFWRALATILDVTDGKQVGGRGNRVRFVTLVRRRVAVQQRQQQLRWGTSPEASKKPKPPTCAYRSSKCMRIAKPKGGQRGYYTLCRKHSDENAGYQRKKKK
jgi:hypothetical protein